MKKYVLEARRRTLKGEIVLGARAGYDGKREISLAELFGLLGQVSAEVPRSVSCFVSQEALVGRTGDTGYAEPVFRLRLSLSPRSKPMSRNAFYNVLREYADRLGSRMEQERVYIEFDGKTMGFRRKNGKGV